MRQKYFGDNGEELSDALGELFTAVNQLQDPLSSDYAVPERPDPPLLAHLEEITSHPTPDGIGLVQLGVRLHRVYDEEGIPIGWEVESEFDPDGLVYVTPFQLLDASGNEAANLAGTPLYGYWEEMWSFCTLTIPNYILVLDDWIGRVQEAVVPLDNSAIAAQIAEVRAKMASLLEQTRKIRRWKDAGGRK